MKLLLANPRGFCAGVVRAIDVVEVALRHFAAPVYVRHEVVHNRRVVDDLRPPRWTCPRGWADVSMILAGSRLARLSL